MRSHIRRIAHPKRTLRLPKAHKAETHHKKSKTLPLENHVALLRDQIQRMDILMNMRLNTLCSRIENSINLELFFATGEVLPPLNGWAIDPDFGIILVRLLQANEYDCILEFGSGSSTVLIAKALQILHRQRTSHHVFEHAHNYLEKTESLLKSVSRIQPQMHLAPLNEWVEGEQKYYWYNCQEDLSACAQTLTHNPSILALVDGPPGSTCKNARYPVIPHILDTFPSLSELDILLDDANRKDEMEAGHAWHGLLHTRGFTVSVEKFQTDKGILLYRAKKRE
ncbi:MAG: hypothetical protein IJU76_12715 [Desulfovibrionaceae bacterium]|nr:hypothetical protein [Desulfovibrionaceae bacterium]